MSNYFRTFLGILITLAITRFIPHPPNFTSLIALGFYVPAILGIKFIPALIISLALTDLLIGFHNTIFFTWGSIIIIGLISKYFTTSIYYRITGALSGAVLFFIITNFGVWSYGQYGYNLEGFLLCYTLALPFFGYSLISTFLFSAVIEAIYRVKIIKNYFNLIKLQ